MNMRERLRTLLKLEGILVVPGAHDVLTAKIVEKVGFQALYLPGSGVSYTYLGKPDLGLLTLNEMCGVAARITDVVEIPLIADADTGYGDVLNVIRTVREYERAGVAAIQLEDQVFPKRCGHFRNHKLIAKEEMVSKLKAAADARKDENFMIIARTDARASYGLDESVERAVAYSEAGADIIFVQALESIDEMKVIVKSVNSYLMAAIVEGGRTPDYSAKELEEIGYDIVIFPSVAARVVANSVTKLMIEIMKKGTTRECMHELLLFSEINELLDLRKINQTVESYSNEK